MIRMQKGWYSYISDGSSVNIPFHIILGNKLKEVLKVFEKLLKSEGK